MAFNIVKLRLLDAFTWGTLPTGISCHMNHAQIQLMPWVLPPRRAQRRVAACLPVWLSAFTSEDLADLPGTAILQV